MSNPDNKDVNTIISGDEKGDSQSIGSQDVGSLDAVLNTGSDTGASINSGSTVNPETPPPPPEDGAATQLEETPPPPPVAQAKAVTTTVRLTPANVSNGTKDKSAKPSAAPSPISPETPPAVAGTVLKQSTSSSNDQLDEVTAAMEVATMQSQSALHQVIDFCNKMAPGKPQNTDSLKRNQMQLHSALYTIVSSEAEHFPVVYRALIAIFNQHINGAMSLTSRARGLDAMTLAEMDNRNMRFITKLTTLLWLSAGTKDPEDVKRNFDLKGFLEGVNNTRARQNLTAFYS